MKGWQKTSFIDYPGKIASVLFAGGCNMRCPYCHNRELVLDPGKLTDISLTDVLRTLNTKRHLYEGVVISGGEPLLDESIVGLMRELKQMAYPVKLDTNGTRPGFLKQLVQDGLVDYVAVDIKTSWTKYPQCLASDPDGTDIPAVQATLAYLREGSPVEYELRSTLFPPLFEASDLAEIASAITGARRYYLQQYKPGNTIADTDAIRPFTQQRLEELRVYFTPYVEKVALRGI